MKKSIGFAAGTKEWVRKTVLHCGEGPGPVVRFTEKAFSQVCRLMLSAGDTEFSVYGITMIEPGPLTQYTILGVVVPDQTRSAGHFQCDFPEEIHVRLGKKNPALGLWTCLHSHHSMKMNGFSSIDDNNVNITNKVSVVIDWSSVNAVADCTTPCGKIAKRTAIVVLPFDSGPEILAQHTRRIAVTVYGGSTAEVTRKRYPNTDLYSQFPDTDIDTPPASTKGTDNWGRPLCRGPIAPAETATAKAPTEVAQEAAVPTTGKVSFLGSQYELQPGGDWKNLSTETVAEGGTELAKLLKRIHKADRKGQCLVVLEDGRKLVWSVKQGTWEMIVSAH